MDDAEVLLGELKALHRGSGIWRADLGAALGPRIADALGLDPASPLMRTELVGHLTRLASDLPNGPREAFLAGSGITSKSRLLHERLAEIDLDRGGRTLRRRLAQAEILIAQRLAAELAGRFLTVATTRGWVIQRMESIARLDLAQPVVSVVRELLVTQPLTEVVGTFSVPAETASERSEIRVSSIGDTPVASLERLSLSSWRYRIPLGRTVEPGEEFTYGIGLTFASIESVQPYLLTIPSGTCRYFKASVRLAHATTKLWRLEGISPMAIGDPRPADDVESITEMVVEFTDLIPGFAYGLRWG